MTNQRDSRLNQVTIQIRKSEPSDGEKILAIVRRLASEDSIWQTRIRPVRRGLALAGPDRVFLVATEQDGEILGFCLARRVDKSVSEFCVGDEDVHVDYLCVQREHRGRGIALRLLEELPPFFPEAISFAGNTRPGSPLLRTLERLSFSVDIKGTGSFYADGTKRLRFSWKTR